MEYEIDDHKDDFTLVAKGDDWPDEWSCWLENLVEKFANLVDKAYDSGANITEIYLLDGRCGKKYFAEEIGVVFDQIFWEGECISGLYQYGWIKTSDIPSAEKRGLEFLSELEEKLQKHSH